MRVAWLQQMELDVTIGNGDHTRMIVSTSLITQKMVEHAQTIMVMLPILIFASVTHANIYKCYDADGRIQFSDKPCDENSEAIELQPLNISSSTKPANSDAGAVEFSDKVDLLTCPGGEGTKLPAKLCKKLSSGGCSFNSQYLKRIVTSIDELKVDISDKQVELLKRHSDSKTEVWEFGTPGNEWDIGTGIRGYVVMKKENAKFFVATLYQGLPNKQPGGQARLLPLDSTHLTRCSARTVLDKI